MNKLISNKKRENSQESNLIIKKKFKHSTDVTNHWKKLYSVFKNNTTKIFECNSKNDCKNNIFN